VASTARIAAGDLLTKSVSLLGLGALVLASSTLFVALKWIGALYLIWLGIKLTGPVCTSGPLELPEIGPISLGNVFGHTAAVTALNPKSIAFFIAFVPQTCCVRA
jgi:threonine/homoserine/homoserine lactone efflux protein